MSHDLLSTLFARKNNFDQEQELLADSTQKDGSPFSTAKTYSALSPGERTSLNEAISSCISRIATSALIDDLLSASEPKQLEDSEPDFTDSDKTVSGATTQVANGKQNSSVGFVPVSRLIVDISVIEAIAEIDMDIAKTVEYDYEVCDDALLPLRRMEEMMEERGEERPAVDIVRCGSKYKIVNGRHRLARALLLGEIMLKTGHTDFIVAGGESNPGPPKQTRGNKRRVEQRGKRNAARLEEALLDLTDQLKGQADTLREIQADRPKALEAPKTLEQVRFEARDHVVTVDRTHRVWYNPMTWFSANIFVFTMSALINRDFGDEKLDDVPDTELNERLFAYLLSNRQDSYPSRTMAMLHLQALRKKFYELTKCTPGVNYPLSNVKLDILTVSRVADQRDTMILTSEADLYTPRKKGLLKTLFHLALAAMWLGVKVLTWAIFLVLLIGATIALLDLLTS
jgi:hypothetical protein